MAKSLLLVEDNKLTRMRLRGFLDGLGLEIVEAANGPTWPDADVVFKARGIPVVGCAISAMNEIIANGRTGLLVPPSDPEAFAAAIISLLLDAPLRNRLGDQGRQVAVEHYSAERMAFEMELWYRKILLDLGHITPEGGN